MTCTLVANGTAAATVVVKKGQNGTARTAAAELQRYVAKATGAKLPVVDDDHVPHGTLIHMGPNRLIERLDVSPGHIGPEGCAVKTVDAENLVFLGSDEPGLRFGVYAFLERYLGVRWFFPGEIGEVVPKRSSLAVEDVDFKEEPDYRMRWLGTSPEEETDPEVSLWKWRNRIGRSLKLNRGHAFDAMVPPEKYFAEHPEYFALIDGKRGGPYILKKKGVHYQLCTTNPDVLRLCVEYFRRTYDEDPSLECESVSPNDGFGWCECETCRALDSGETIAKHGWTHPCVSDRIFSFVNQIARELRKTHPDKYITAYVYTDHILPPKSVGRIESNVIPMLATGSKDNWNPALMAENVRILEGWSEISDRLAIYDYYMYQGMPTTPRPITKLIGDWIPRCHRAGARYFYAQARDDFATNGPNYYLAARLLWDSKRDPDTTLQEYFNILYGPAASAVRAYYDVLEDAWRELTAKTAPGWSGSDLLPEFYTPEALVRCRQHLEDARRLAESEDPTVRDRVEFVREGFRYLETYMRAFRLTMEVRDHAIPITDSWLSTNPVETTRLLQRALEAWEERDQLLHSLRNRHVVGVDHDLSHRCRGTMEKLRLQWLIDAMEAIPWPGGL